jgi:aminopeptidase YwaD
MSLGNVEGNLVFSLSAPRMFGHVETLCGFGPRYIGSEAAEKTIAYLEAELARCGAKVERCPFEISHFQEIGSELKLLSPQERGFECQANYRSVSSPEGGIVADRVVDVGYGTEEEFQGKDLKGAMALATDGRVRLSNLVDSAQKRGAVGCIVVRRRPDGLIPTHGLHHHGSPIPAVSIRHRDGQVLRDLARQGPIQVLMKVQTDLDRGQADSLLGILEGQGNPEEVWAIVAHYESLPHTPGANDNASGVAVALEMLRAFSSLRLSRTLWFIFSTGHEGGMMGMFDFVEQRKKELRRIRGLINLDEVGQGPILRALKYGELVPGIEVATSEHLNSVLLGAAEDLGYQLDNSYTSRVGGLADAHPFAEAGVPVAWLSKGVSAALYGHTAEDTPDTIEINALKIPADILAVSLLRLDGEEI